MDCGIRHLAKVKKTFAALLLVFALVAPAHAFGLPLVKEVCRIVSGWLGPWRNPPPPPKPFDWKPPTDAKSIDETFGTLQSPSMIRDGELRAISSPDFVPTGTAYHAENRLNITTLNPRTKYIWLVDEKGNLVIGKEKFVGSEIVNPGYSLLAAIHILGHPGLLGPGKKARIAGELYFESDPKKSGGKWIINNSSGRFNGVQTIDGFNAYPDRGEKQLTEASHLFRYLGLTVDTQPVKP